MAFQFSVGARNASLDAIETTIGIGPTLELRTGAPPATCATADSGTVLATMTLPSDWAAAASGGAKTLLGTWQDTSADAAAVIVTATGTPTVQYNWQAADTDTAGFYDAEFEVTYAGGAIETFPNADFIRVSITGDIA